MLSAGGNKKLLARFIEQAWNNENLDAMDEFLASPCSIHHDPSDPWDGQTLDVAGSGQG
ncbi:MAG: hypothetical protein ACR2Q4_08285 [Geminicoccaceae bacterium]